MPRHPLLPPALTGVAVTLLLAFGVLDPVELPVRDAALRRLPERAAEATVVIAIDEASLREVGPWPWPRATLARLVDRAAESGVRGVVLDTLLAEERPGDEELARAMRRVPTIAVAVLDDRGTWLMAAPALSGASTAAHGNFELDHDGILRRLSATKQNSQRSLTAVAIEAASLVHPIAVPVGRTIHPAFRTPARGVPEVSAATLLRNPQSLRGPQNLRGRIAFIGPIALALGDRVLTPTSAAHRADPGVTVHAATTESILRGEVLRITPPWAAGLAAALLVAFCTSRRVAIATAVAIIAGGLLLLGTAQVAIPFVTLLTVLAIGVAAAETSTVTAKLGKLVARQGEEAESKRRLAHELRTPLASMRGLTQLLAGFQLSETERARVAELLQNEAGKLESMVEVLLDLERLPLRDFASSATVFDLGALVRERMELLRAGTKRELILTFRGERAAGVRVRGDSALLERVLDNLVGNALKYTAAPAPIRVAVGDDHGQATLDVIDQGPGVAPADRERVFQRFVRGSTAAGTQGLGLGLAMVADIVRWHGGSISVDDAPGGGARFRVRLPLEGGR
jgi:signal transduction histidine kinase